MAPLTMGRKNRVGGRETGRLTASVLLENSCSAHDRIEARHRGDLSRQILRRGPRAPKLNGTVAAGFLFDEFH